MLTASTGWQMSLQRDELLCSGCRVVLNVNEILLLIITGSV